MGTSAYVHDLAAQKKGTLNFVAAAPLGDMYILCCKNEYLYYEVDCRTGGNLPEDAIKLDKSVNKYHAVCRFV